MKFVSDPVVLFRRNEAAFDAATTDVRDDARRTARRVTGKFANSIEVLRVSGGQYQMNAVVGSPLASAHVKEKGGYMQAKRHDRLYIRQADGSALTPQAVRVRATPAVTPAGARFPDYMKRRLIEANR